MALLAYLASRLAAASGGATLRVQRAGLSKFTEGAAVWVRAVDKTIAVVVKAVGTVLDTRWDSTISGT
jgi:hypothetical protein